MLVPNTMGLRERLAEVADSFDVAVIDTSPTPSLLHEMIYLASDYVIYPTECEALSLRGLADTTAHVAQVDAKRAAMGLKHIHLLGVLPTLFRPQTNAHIHGQALLEKHYGEKAVYPAITHRTVWVDGAYEKRSLFDYAPGHPATLEITGLVSRVARQLHV
jgi:chromosome partitioning protein